MSLFAVVSALVFERRQVILSCLWLLCTGDSSFMPCLDASQCYISAGGYSHIQIQ